MKKVFAFLLAFFFLVLATDIQAQDVNKCRPIAERLLSAAQKHQPDDIDELLAPDFHYSDYGQPIASKVLKQIIVQMPTLSGSELMDVKQDSTVLSLQYRLLMEPDNATSDAIISFSVDNLILEADLLPGMVKLKVSSDATPSAMAPPEVSMVRVPIRICDGVPVVTVAIDGQTCNMIFDTGAPDVILNSKYFGNNVNEMATGISLGVVGSDASRGVHRVGSMDMGGLMLGETSIVTSDLSNLESGGIAVHGILGQNFYKDFDVLFDYKNKEIVLLNPEVTHQWLQNERYHYWAVTGVMKRHLLAFDCQVGGTSVVLAFDSGAQSNLLSEDWPKSHPSSVKRIKKATLIGYGDGEASIITGKTSLTMAGRTFKRLQTAFSDVSFLQEFVGIDGLFGSEVLKSRKILISYKRHELILLDK